ncbi:MAG: aldehyde dehydrogenase family protein [Phycisphaerales bacterium]
MTRIPVLKTYKLLINGAFPRSESGRSLPISNAKGNVLAHVAHASRKDLRDAVEAARAAQPKWAAATAYNRAQVLYRLAEMMEGKREELAEAIASVPAEARAPARARPGVTSKRARSSTPSLSPSLEVSLAIDRVVHYAGWADKYGQVLGCNNPVAGPFYNFTSPEPTGVVVCLPPDQAPLLALLSLAAPALCAGNAVVTLASESNPIPSMILAEAAATSDLPGGVLNILTGPRAELIPHIAPHRDVDAVHAANLPADQHAALRAGAAENLKRVTVRENSAWADNDACNSPWWIEPFVEFKTMWHPVSA